MMSESKSMPFSKSHFGVNDHDFWFHLRPLDETELIFRYGSKLISDSGMHWNRVHLPGVFSWNVIEHEKGKYDWAIPDTLVKSAQDYNINVLPNIWPFAAWDQKAWVDTGKREIVKALAEGKAWKIDDTYPLPLRYDGPHDWDAYSKWIFSMVERYDGDGKNDMPGLKYPIKYWEPGNEPFGRLFWPSRDHHSFAEFTKISYLAAKKADPKCKILIGGGEFFAMKRFFKEVLELGKKDNQHYFDIINLHIPSVRSADELLQKDIVQNLQSTKELLVEYKLEVPIWFTEFGTHIGSQEFIPRKGSGMSPPPLPFQTNQDQVEYFIKGTTVAFEKGVEKVFWQGLGPIRPPNVELTEPIPESFSSSYSQACLLDTEGKPRMVYHVVKLFVELLDNFETVKKLNFGDGIEAYDYCNGFYVLWCDGEQIITLEGLEEGYLKVIQTIPKIDSEGNLLLSPTGNVQFNVQDLKVIHGKVTINLKKTPIIVEKKIN